MVGRTPCTIEIYAAAPLVGLLGDGKRLNHDKSGTRASRAGKGPRPTLISAGILLWEN